MLTVEHLSKSYGDVKALSDISFSLQAGEVVALLGANGSGKTTTINAICNLIEYEQGDIQFNGQNTRNNPRYLKQIGAVLGGCRNINWRLSARQNADYFARLRGAEKSHFQPNIEILEERLGLSQYRNKAVRKLSTGNKQKAALLSALCYSPALLLLDEPTLGLDVTTVNELQAIIKQQASDQQQGFLITSHDMSFIDKICSRAIVIDAGKQLFDGPIKALKEKLHHYEMLIQLSQSDAQTLQKALEALWQGKFQHHWDQNILTVRYDEPVQGLPTLNFITTQGITPLDLRITPLSIENAYLSLIEETAQ